MHGVYQRQRKQNKFVVQNNIRAQQLAENIAHHMSYIYAIVLYDKMDFTFKRLDNLFLKVYETKRMWQDDNNTDITSESLLRYALSKKIDAPEFVKSIPMSEKLNLSDIKGRCAIGGPETINSGLLATILLMLPTLKEHYKFSNKRIEEFFHWVGYYIHLYNTKLPKETGNVFSDEYIRQIFIEDEGFDMKIGDYISDNKK